jgi:hypothetical protein
MTAELSTILAAVVWSVIGTVLSQAIAIAVLWWLGLPPRKLIHQIEVVQNAAVGACFFIISLTVGLFVGILTSNGFTESFGIVDGAIWIASALLLGAALMWISFLIAYRVMGIENGESIYRYLQRELIEEQNTALAFFLGGLAVVPFVCVIFQVI